MFSRKVYDYMSKLMSTTQIKKKSLFGYGVTCSEMRQVIKLKKDKAGCFMSKSRLKNVISLLVEKGESF